MHLRPLLFWLLLICGSASADEVGRRIAAHRAACYLLDVVEEPKLLNVDFEYSLQFLLAHHPSSADPATFSWQPVPEGTTSENVLLIVRNNARYFRLTFHRGTAANGTAEFSAVLLLYESSPDYFQPIFVAYPEMDRIDGNLVSNRKHLLAYTTALRESGTGAHTMTYLFDLANRPKLKASARGYRLRLGEFHLEQAYRRAREKMRHDHQIATGN